MCFSLFGGERIDADKKAIEAIVYDYQRSWNESAGYDFSKHFSEDSYFINIFDMKFLGREEIEARHVKILETFLKDSEFTTTNIEIHPFDEDRYVVYVEWSVSGFHAPGTDYSLPGRTITGMFAHIFVRSGDTFEITYTRNHLEK